ncbi:flagellar assembly protein FliW [Schinkia azotoformans]|uniref:flagellar assembly protein FliW n=1 Tax=Schinkia azotoformans TaxID=1454 RepID=UPI002E1A1879|nr:flagellar assembly protein FliW [Schinkia azotoformans]MED4350963.1 flagellar assembly protein FliW [Schinkia azotoformans]
MKIQTKYHGEVEINDKEIIHFEEGIPSFEDEKKFVILPFGEDSPFLILQSVQSPSLGFVITSPFDFFNDYSVKLSDLTLEKLKIENDEHVAVFSILTVQDPFHNTTANLRGPVVINTKEQLGKQIILNDEKYTTKHFIIQTPAPVSEEGK